MTVGLSRVEQEVQWVRAEMARRGRAVQGRASDMAGLAVATAVLHDRLEGLLGSSAAAGGEEEDGACCPPLTDWYTTRIEPALDEFSGLYHSLAREGFDRQLFRRCLQAADEGRPPIIMSPPPPPAHKSAEAAIAERITAREREVRGLPCLCAEDVVARLLT